MKITGIAVAAKLWGDLKCENQNPLHEEEGAWMQAPVELSRRGWRSVFA
jgi:hypothetical protein